MKKPTTWRPNSTLKAPSKPIPRSVAPKKVNRARMKKRNTEAFGDKASWIRASPCVVSVSERYRFDGNPECMGGMEASHIRSRGAGGRAKDLVPMCALHHHRFHQWGRITFGATYELDLNERAAYYESLWQNSRFNPDNVSGEQQ